MGYLYAYDDTTDNILLNFDLSVTSILIGRIGYGITIMVRIKLTCCLAVETIVAHRVFSVWNATGLFALSSRHSFLA